MKYNIDEIAKKQKRARLYSILLRVFAVLLLIFSAVGIILSSSNVLLFVISAICLIASSAILIYEKKTARFSGTKTYSGRIEKIDFTIGAGNGILTVGYGGLVPKRYSTYHRDINNLTLYIRTKDCVVLTRLNDVSKNITEYYQENDEVIHIGGTLFPVHPEFGVKWLCPVCGEFNLRETHICNRCKNTITKTP